MCRSDVAASVGRIHNAAWEGARDYQSWNNRTKYYDRTNQIQSVEILESATKDFAPIDGKNENVDNQPVVAACNTCYTNNKKKAKTNKKKSKKQKTPSEEEAKTEKMKNFLMKVRLKADIKPLLFANSQCVL